MELSPDIVELFGKYPIGTSLNYVPTMLLCLHLGQEQSCFLWPLQSDKPGGRVLRFWPSSGSRFRSTRTLSPSENYLETAQLIHFSHFRKWGAHSVCGCMQPHFLILYEFNWEKWLLGGLLWHLPKNDQWILETICDSSPSGQSAQGSSCPAWGAGKDTRHSPGADVGRASSVKKKSSDVSYGWKPVIS